MGNHSVLIHASAVQLAGTARFLGAKGSMKDGAQVLELGALDAGQVMPDQIRSYQVSSILIVFRIFAKRNLFRRRLNRSLGASNEGPHKHALQNASSFLTPEGEEILRAFQHVSDELCARPRSPSLC